MDLMNLAEMTHNEDSNKEMNLSNDRNSKNIINSSN